MKKLILSLALLVSGGCLVAKGWKSIGAPVHRPVHYGVVHKPVHREIASQPKRMPLGAPVHAALGSLHPQVQEYLRKLEARVQQLEERLSAVEAKVQ